MLGVICHRTASLNLYYIVFWYTPLGLLPYEKVWDAHQKI